MCYPKPGPRCSAHARKKYFQAQAISRNEPYSFDNAEKLRQAQLEYYMTPAGMRELKRLISIDEDKDENEMLLDYCNAARQEALQKIKMIDIGDPEHHHVYKDGLGKSRKTLYSLPDKNQVRESWNISNDGGKKFENTYIEESARWIDTLTPDELIAVRWSTSNGFTEMDALRKGEPLPEYYDDNETQEEKTLRVIRYQEALNSALSKAPKRSRILYRGLSVGSTPKELHFSTKNDYHQEKQYASSEEHAIACEKYYKEIIGTEITFERPVSTTSNSSVASSFAGRNTDYRTPNVVYEISARSGAAVGVASAWGSSEAEYLTPSNVKYRVKNVIRKGKFKSKSRRDATVNIQECVIIQLEEIE